MRRVVLAADASSIEEPNEIGCAKIDSIDSYLLVKQVSSKTKLEELFDIHNSQPATFIITTEAIRHFIRSCISVYDSLVIPSHYLHPLACPYLSTRYVTTERRLSANILRESI